MKKNIAILVRDRTEEALRMAVGATLANDTVRVFVMNGRLDTEDEDIEVNLQMLNDLNVSLYTNNSENPFECLSSEEIAQFLAEADVIIPY